MVDQFTRTEHQGFFSRLASSFFGVLVGFLMIPGSICLLSWNEYRTIHRTRGLAEAEKVVEPVADPMEIDPKLEGKLVHVSGTATTDETLSDPDFSLSRVALQLRREVEMYQWVETKESKTRDKLGGGKETVTTYRYERKWHSGRIDSDHFEERTGHANPTPLYATQTFVAKKGTLGALQLRSDLVRQISEWKTIPIDIQALLNKMDDATRKRFAVEGDQLVYSADPAQSTQPSVGDLRIRFRFVDPTTVSILSSLKQRGLEPYATSNGETVESLVVGAVSATKMFEGLKQENTMFAMILRLIGWVLACVGFGLIVGPIKALANVIPFLGQLVGIATGAIAFLLGSCVALLTIGLAWFAVRPLYAIALFGLSAFGLFVLFRKRKTTVAPVQQPPMATLID
jgi:hypothetical protein